MEREVSRISARTIAGALDPSRYDVIPVAVGPDGRFLPAEESRRLLAAGPVPEKFRLPRSGEASAQAGQALVPAEISPAKADVVFPIIHGTTGEDGMLQGFLEFLGIPYVGAGVTGSAIGMDKSVFKSLLRDAGIPTTRFLTLSPRERAGVRAQLSASNSSFFAPPLRQTLQRRLLRRRDQSEGLAPPRPRPGPRLPLRRPRPHRGRRGRAGTGVRRPRQRRPASLDRRRSRAGPRVLRLRRQVPRGQRETPDPGAHSPTRSRKRSARWP